MTEEKTTHPLGDPEWFDHAEDLGEVPGPDDTGELEPIDVDQEEP